MKRTFLGILAMGSIVGLGSAGVYYAQQKFAPRAEAAQVESSADAPQTAPQPIPLAANSPQQEAERHQTYANPPAVADDYASRPAAEVVPTDEAPAEEARYDAAGEPSYAADAVPVETAASDIPDAAAGEPYAEPSAPAGRTPFVGGGAPPSGSRYDAQPAAAQEPVEAAPEPYASQPAASPDGGEPRPLERQPAGNPLRSDYGNQAQGAAERYGEQGYPAAGSEVAAPQGGPVGPLTQEGDGYGPQGGPEGTGRPGDPALHGAQSPALTIEKIAPPEIQIGKPAQFLIKVKNVGTATARNVEIHDAVPQGTQLVDTSPPAGRGPDGAIVWELGALKPGDEQTVEMQLMPTSEGEVGSVATVRFHAEASARTVVTRPMLNIEVFGPSKVLKGQQVVLRIKLSNPGSGAASGVILTENVPQGLSHPQGKELEFEVGTLKPGESRELDLALVAAEPGMVANSITVKGDANLLAEARTEIEVVAPQLAVTLTGPKRRYLERNATHNISVSNPGTAAAKDIDLVAVLPRNLKFVEANNGGQYDATTNAVYWSLEELPPQETGTVKLTTLPLEAGDARLLIKSTSKDGLKDEREEVVAIEGLAALNFQLADVKDPIEVGGETAYEIKVTNQGTKAASNVRLAALVPAGMKPLSAEGPVRFQIEGQYVRFEPLKQLAPKADTSFTIKVKAVEPGDQRIEVQVATDEITEPIAKQESTRVYGDE